MPLVFQLYQVLLLKMHLQTFNLLDTDTGTTSNLLGNSGNIFYSTSSSNRDHIFRGSTTEVARITGDAKVGINTDNPNGQFHIHSSTAGDVTAGTDANNLVIEASSNVGMSFLTANNSIARIKFGDPDDTGSGVISYTHSTNSMGFHTNDGTKGLVINSDGHVVPAADSTYDLGLTGTRWRNLYADTLYGDGSNLTGIDADKFKKVTHMLKY